MIKLYHFLGGVKFAIFLIAAAAIFVISGTLIESKTGSHALSANLTYKSPLFALLIWGFFINILFSATRRFPFKKRHIPFLITHLGLLMILGGVMVKNYFGTQGNMILAEGAGSDEIVLAEGQAIIIEDGTRKTWLTLDHPALQIVDYHPHSTKKLESFIKGDQCTIYGLKPFAVNDSSALAPVVQQLKILPDYPEFDVIAFHLNEKDTLRALAEKLYLKEMTLIVKNEKNGEIIYRDDLSKAIERPVIVPEGLCEFDLNFDFDNPSLITSFSNEDDKLKKEITILLTGDKALENLPSCPYLKKIPHDISLQRKPLLLLIEDEKEELFIFVYDASGRIFTKAFQNKSPPIFAYNNGFDGYTAQLEFPLNPLSAKEALAQKIAALKKQLNESTANQPLCTPLQLLKEACCLEGLNFADVLVDYLTDSKPQAFLPKLNFNSIPKREFKTCCWMAHLIPAIEDKLNKGYLFLELMELSGWPLMEGLKEVANQNKGLSSLFEELIVQMYALADELPEIETIDPAATFSYLLKLYSIHLHQILPENVNGLKTVTIEAPLSLKQEKATPHQKIEDNVPLVKFKINNELITLTYDKYGNELKWPTSDARYLLKFGPQSKKLPYRIRLRNARNIAYPNSTSNYSFEADLIVTDKEKLTKKEVTISMNNVHETWDGYRFYLSNISPGGQGALQHVQIAVNHDPAKYILTYPGALILSLGILLLFWLYKK